MIITCPHCGFSKKVPSDRLPDGAVVATCPKCSCRFRIENGRQVDGRTDRHGNGACGPEGRGVAAGTEKAANDAMGETSDSSKARDCGHGENPDADDDPRLMAARAYEREAMRFARQEIANPWDAAPGDRGWLGCFMQCVLRVMFAAPHFFAGLSPRSGQGRALFFYLIVCVFQILVEHMWSGVIYSTLAPGAESDPRLAEMLALLQSEQNFVLTLLRRSGMFVLNIYVCSLLIFFVYRLLVQERASFSLVFQVLAYSSAPALLCILPAVGTIAGMIWGVACAIIGMGASMRLTLPQSILGFLPILFIFAPLAAQGLNLLV